MLSSATGPSTDRCSKDVTTHQHRPGARPGSPCPVPACSGQPLPGERRFSSALGNRVHRVCCPGDTHTLWQIVVGIILSMPVSGCVRVSCSVGRL
jgi:hypothetical protein